MVGRVSCILLCSVVLTFTWVGTYGAWAADEDSIPTPNWTIGADGKGRWDYGRITQLGSNGFFGPYDVDRSAGGNFAPVNGWMGVQNYQNTTATNILVSGTNSSSSVLGLELNPTTTFGWASVTGRYKFTPYDTGTAPGAEVSISPGQWTHWNIGLTMPIGGSLFVGKKYFTRGCGLQFGQNRTQEYLLFESYGTPMPDFLTGWLPSLVKQPKIDPIRPLTLKICRKPIPCSAEAIDTPETDPDDGSKYLPFSGSEAEIAECIASGRCTETEVDSDCPEGTFPLRWKDPVTGVVAPYEKCSGRPVYEGAWNDWATLKFGFGFLPWQQDTLITTLSLTPSVSPGPVLAISPTFWNNYDVNVAQRVSLIAYLMWYNDVINFEVGTLYYASHAGPELARTTPSRNAFAPTNFYTSEGWVYLKYLNGRYCLSAELDWFTREIRYQKSSDGTFFGAPDNTDGSGSLFAPQFIESLRFVADARVQFGPAVFMLFYSHMPGADRRHGILIRKQPFVSAVPQVALDPFYSVSTLLAYRFGGGVNSPGDLSDASVIAGRIDYALAANLSVNVSILHATRVSHGYGWGWIRPALNNFGQVAYDAELATFLLPPLRPFTENIPAIPARDLGWEVGAGLTWQLLNQFIVEFTLSYWKPGRWFNYACVDKSVAGWDNPTAANNWGVNPDRTIDPVLGIGLAFLSSF